MKIKIGKDYIGDKFPAYLIAEAGVNHNGSLRLGKRLIDIAKFSGANAVKFQTFKADNIIIPNGPKAQYHIETTGRDKKLSWRDLLISQEISKKMHVELIKYCKKKKITFLSTPYDEESADLLDELGVVAYKIASTDNDNYPLLAHIAKKNKPMIISTAMCSLDEVLKAKEVIKKNGCKNFAFLQCTGNYPSKTEDANINVIKTYIKKLNCPIGYSDHTQNDISAITSISLGAKIIEKHFTVNKKLFGPDHRISLEKKELKLYFNNLRIAEKSLGTYKKEVLKSEKDNRLKLKKSVVTAFDLKKGDILKLNLISIKRPGNGIRPTDINKILRKKLKLNLKRNTVIKKWMLK